MAVHRPVLIILQSAHFESVKKLTSATDLKNDDTLIIEWLSEFVERLDTELSIEHVSPDANAHLKVF